MPNDTSLADELNRLRELASRGDVGVFYNRLLSSVSQFVSAEAGLVWSCSSPPYRLICEQHLQANPSLRRAIQQNEHLALLENAINRKQPMLIPPRKDAPESMPIIALAPVQRNGDIDLIELFLRSSQGEQEYQRWLQCLQKYCEVASQLNGVAVESLPATTARRPIAEESLDQFVDQVHRDLLLKPTATRVANETRRLLNADRVTVVQRVRSKGRAIAISGQPSVNRRSNTVQMLERLVNRVLPLQATFWYPEDDQEIPAEIEQPLNDYLTISTTRNIVIVPILSSEPPATPDLEVKPHRRRWIAGLVIEQFDGKWTKDEMATPIDFVTRHCSSAIRNAIDHRTLLFYPLWETLGKSKIVVAARNIRRSVLIASAVVALIAALVFIKIPFQVSCDGILIPSNRQNVFAQVSGIVDQVDVQHGDHVTQGEVVIQLTDNNLLIERQRALGEIARLEQQLGSMNTQLLNPGRRRENETQPSSDSNELLRRSLDEQLASKRTELDIIQSQIDQLVVTSPMAGQVLSWDIVEKLKDKPVQRGDALLEVADVDGPWELELKLPDRRIGHLLRAQRESKEPLDVTFLLAAGPSEKWYGEVESIAQTTDVDQQNGQTIRVRVRFPYEKLDIKQARSGVMAKIDCGYRSMGYVWLHDIWEFLQAKVFFRLW